MAIRVTSSRLVGRDAELATLEAALTDAGTGHPSLVFVAGDSGVGKSRLVAELEDRARAIGAHVLHGDSVELGEGDLPYGPLVGALRPLARTGDDLLDGLSPSSRSELGRLLPGLGTGSPPSPSGPDGTAQAWLFEAILELLDRLGDDETALLVLEDLHWADPSTRAFLVFLARSLTRERVLVIGTYRSDELHRRHPLRPLLAELERDPAIRRVDLAPLTRDEVEATLEDILGASPSADLVDRVRARTGGNPLFIEEVLAAGLDGRGGLPATLRDALIVRIDRLGEAAQEVLRVLAVAQRADHALLAEASGIEATALRSALREAVLNHLIVADGDDRYTFRHALLREVVEDDLLPGERQALHLAVARALAPRRDEPQVAAGIASHYAAAGDQPAALGASVRAGLAAWDVHAYGEATKQLERVLELWEHVPDAEALAGADRVTMLERAALARSRSGEHARAEALVGAALELVDPAKDVHRAATLLERLAAAQWRQGKSEAALQTAQRGLDILPDGDQSAERASLLAWWAKTRMLQGRYREAVRAGREAIAAAEAAGDWLAAGAARNAVGFGLIQQDEIEEGTRHLVAAMDIARRGERPFDVSSAAVNLGDALQLAGRLDEGIAVTRQALDEVEAGGLVAVWHRIAVAEMEIEAGHLDEADRLMPDPDRRMSGLNLVNAELRRAELALVRGAHDSAASSLERIAGLVADSGEPQFHGVYGALLAELRRRGGDLDGARAAVDEALDRIEFCTEDAMRIARVAASGVTVEADRAQRGRDLGDPEETARALRGVEDLGLRVEAAAAEGRPLESAWLRNARAEAARAASADDPALWAAAADGWEALRRPLQALSARRHEAEALVLRDDRDGASRVAGDALERARAIRADWLVGELEALCSRARLRHVAGRTRTDDGAVGATGAANPDDDPFGLTPREQQVLALVARGATNREIGAELFMAEKTASVHVSRILAKLDVRSRTQAAAVAHRLRLVDE